MADDKDGPEREPSDERRERLLEPAAADSRAPSELTIFDSIVSLLQLTSGERFVEILGTQAQSWTPALLGHGSLRCDALVVTSPAAGDRALGGVPRLQMDPIEFATSRDSWDKVIVNQVLGHLPDPALLIARLAARLKASGRLLVAELVPGPGDPLHESALRRWRPVGPGAGQIADWLRAAGLIVLMARVERTRRSADRLHELASQLAATAGSGARGEDHELRAALEELERTHSGRRASEFTECFDLILGAVDRAASSDSPRR